MSRALKLKNNDYWDSKCIVYNKQTLYDLLNPVRHNLTIVSKNITSGNACYYQLGKMVILCINALQFSKETNTHQEVLFSGLPAPKSDASFMLVSEQNNLGRVNIMSSNLVIWYSTFKTELYNGQYVYITI